MDGANAIEHREFDLAPPPDEPGFDLSLGARKLLTEIVAEAFRDLESEHAGRRAGAYRWFTSRRRDAITHFVPLCEALNLSAHDLRNEALRRWGEHPMSTEAATAIEESSTGSVTRRGTCSDCGAAFSHTFANKFGGRMPKRCQPCRAIGPINVPVTRKPGVHLGAPKVTPKVKPIRAAAKRSDLDQLKDLIAELESLSVRREEIRAEINAIAGRM